MNTFGRLFRVSIFGESHGPGVGILIDGCPAGLPLEIGEFAFDLERRKGGAKGTTPRQDTDIPVITSGVYEGRTTGTPLLLTLENKDVRSGDYSQIKDTPRPGHADLTGRIKYGGFSDPRGGGHFSGRLTAALVAAGVVAKKLITPSTVAAGLVEAGGSTDIDAAVSAAVADGDSVGGIVECRLGDLPSGLGEPFFDSVESCLSHAVFSIPAVKGIEFGAGFQGVRLRGSEFNDDILSVDGTTATNNAGGINGGITNGNELVFRIAIKPTSSIRKAKKTVHFSTGQTAEVSVPGRHDACIALRVPVVLEAVAAIVCADLMCVAGKISNVWRG